MCHKKYILLIALTVLIHASLYSQANLSKTDSIKIAALNEKAQVCYLNGDTLGFSYSDSAVFLSTNISHPYLIGNSLKQKGIGYYYLGQNAKALEAYEHALVYFNQIKDSTQIACCYNNIAVADHVMGDLQKAIAMHLKALKIRERNCSDNDIAMSDAGISNAFNDLGQFEKALDYQQKAIQLYRKDQDSIKLCGAYNNLGSTFSSLNQADSAIFYHEIALAIAERVSNYRNIISASINLANSNMKIGASEKAHNHYNRAIELSEKLNYTRGIASGLENKAILYWHEKKYDQSISLLKKALKLVSSSEEVKQQQGIYYNLSQLYKEINDPENALANFENYVSLKDSISNCEITKNINELETKYQTAEKSKKIILLEAENNLKKQAMKAQQRLLWLVVVSFILFVVIAFGYHHLKKQKQQAVLDKLKFKSLEIEQRMLRSQMNPHFIFNSLNSIQNLISTKNISEAQEYLLKFSKLLRLVLENSRHEFVSLSQEIDALKNYIEIEKLRFGNHFDYHILDQTDEADLIEIPPMMIQPFVENAILHGLNACERKGSLSLTFSVEKDDRLVCTVEDNGIGRTASEDQQKRTNVKNHKSLAMELIANRIKMLTEKFRTDFDFRISDLDPITGEGTKVVLTLPILGDTI